jgi:hypothetical protein
LNLLFFQAHILIILKMTMNTPKSASAQKVLNISPNAARNAVAVVSLLTLAACSSSDPVPAETPEPGANSTSYAYTASRASDYGSGRIDRISLSNGNTVDGSYPATLSDIAVTTDGTNVYQIGRFGIDSVTRFDAVDTAAADYQYSVNVDSEDGSANPYSLAFLSDTKAYLSRYGSTNLWVIDPRGDTEESFKTSEIDLSAYDADGPNMSDVLIVGDKLFVLMERLTGFVPDKTAYIAVIDTVTDTEVQTNQGADGLLGIQLSVTNPTGLQYNAETGEIYVLGRGNYFENAAVTSDFHSGGVIAIDPETFEQVELIDDGTDADNQGYFYRLKVINASLGYLLTYQSFGVTTLRTFNPTTGLMSEDLIEGLQGVDVTVLAHGPDNHLWVGINGPAAGFHRIDLATGVVADEIVATELIPIGLTFIDVPAQ